MVDRLHPYCDMNHPGKEPKVGPYPKDFSQCWLCWVGLNQPEKVVALKEGRPAALQAAAPAPPGRWPWWALLIYLARWRGDVGVGDTVKRRLRQTGIDRVWKRWNGPAGCAPCMSRQARWNRWYGYTLGKGWRLPF